MSLNHGFAVPTKGNNNSDRNFMHVKYAWRRRYTNIALIRTHYDSDQVQQGYTYIN